MFIQPIELKRGSTWSLAVRLKKADMDWTGAVYTVDFRETRESAVVLETVTPTASAQTTDDDGLVGVDIVTVVDAATTEGFPLGRIYADLRVTIPGDFGTQYPVEWSIKNVIQITRSV